MGKSKKACLNPLSSTQCGLYREENTLYPSHSRLCALPSQTWLCRLIPSFATLLGADCLFGRFTSPVTVWYRASRLLRQGKAAKLHILRIGVLHTIIRDEIGAKCVYSPPKTPLSRLGILPLLLGKTNKAVHSGVPNAQKPNGELIERGQTECPPNTDETHTQDNRKR